MVSVKSLTVSVQHQRGDRDARQVGAKVGRGPRFHASERRCRVGLLAERQRFLAVLLAHHERAVGGKEVLREAVEERVAIGAERRLEFLGLLGSERTTL